MRKMKKATTFLAVAGLVVSMTGCGGNAEKPSSDTTEKQDTTEESGQEEEKGADGEVELSVLVVFDPETGSPWKLDSFQEAADKLGYKVNVERTDDETYKTKVRVMLQANELPDLFYTWGGSYSTPFIDAGALYPLEDTIEASGYELEEVYKQTSEDGHIFTVPTGALETYSMYYNKDVFEQLGKEVPTNWEELLDVVEACNEQGIGAIGLGNKDRWEGDLFYNMLVLREDAEAFSNAVNGKESFTGEAFKAAAEKVQTLVDMNAFQSGYMQATQSECSELLKAGKIAMYPTGSWQVSVFKNEPNLGCAVFPKTGEEDPYLSCCGNAADSGMAVNAKSENAEAAAKLAVEYSKILNDHLAEEGEQSYFATDVQTGEQPEMVKNYIADFEKLQKTQLWWFTYLDTSIGEPMRDLSHQQFAGEISPDDFVKELDHIIGEK